FACANVTILRPVPTTASAAPSGRAAAIFKAQPLNNCTTSLRSRHSGGLFLQILLLRSAELVDRPAKHYHRQNVSLLQGRNAAQPQVGFRSRTRDVCRDQVLLHPVLRENIELRIDPAAADKIYVSAYQIEALAHYTHVPADGVNGSDHVHRSASWLFCLKLALQLYLRLLGLDPVVPVNLDVQIDRNVTGSSSAAGVRRGPA